MSKSTTLMAGKFGSKNFGTKPYLREAFERTGAAKPSLVYIGAASGDNRAFGTALCAIARLSGAHAVHWPKLAGKKKESALARELLGEADGVFIGGGDVEEGIKTLHETDVADALREAHGRGAVFCGMSAGAIMLGERWVRWPHEDASDAEAETFPCLGIVPFSLDTHGEGDGWLETRSFATVRARELGAVARAYGIPSGGALLSSGDGRPRALGVPAQVFAAHPGKKAHALADLPVESND